MQGHLFIVFVQAPTSCEPIANEVQAVGPPPPPPPPPPPLPGEKSLECSQCELITEMRQSLPL